MSPRTKPDLPPGRPADAPHLDWVDTAKTLLILLVVLGHFHYSYAPVPGKHLIYAFHVPAFLFITGILLPADFGARPLRAVLGKWIIPNMKLYGFFSALALGLWWLAVSLKAGGAVSPLAAITGVLYGVAGPENRLIHHNQPLWYFPFLTTSLAAAWIFCRFPPWTGRGMAVAYAAFALLYSGPRLPWCLDIGGIGALAVYAGYQTGQSRALTALLASRAQLSGGVVLALAALVILSALNGGTNINGAGFGRNGLLFILAMFSGCALTVCVAALIPPTATARYIARNTLMIFVLHIYFVRLCSGLFPDTGLVAGNVLFILAGTAIAVAGCLILANILQPALTLVLQPHATRPVRVRATAGR